MTRKYEQTELGTLVAARRNELGLSQEDVSEQVGMSKEWTSMLERGRIRQPRITALQRLANVLRLPIEDLVMAAGLSATRVGARRLIPKEIMDPELAASFFSLKELSPKRLAQAREMIEGLRLLDDADFANHRLGGRGDDAGDGT